MGRRTFSREFKLEAVQLVRDRGVAVAQACRDLEIAVSVLRRWMREAETDPRHAVPGQGQHYSCFFRLMWACCAAAWCALR